MKALSDTWPSCGRFVHVSTAFVDPQNHASPKAPQPEGLVPLPCKGGREYDPRALYESMCGDTVLAQQAFEALGFVNTYTFSKCVAEHLMARSGRQVQTDFHHSLVLILCTHVDCSILYDLI